MLITPNKPTKLTVPSGGIGGWVERLAVGVERLAADLGQGDAGRRCGDLHDLVSGKDATSNTTHQRARCRARGSRSNSG
jgi:hypothetical protein